MDRIVMSGTKRKALKAIVQNEIEGTRARRLEDQRASKLAKICYSMVPQHLGVSWYLFLYYIFDISYYWF